MTQNIQPVLKSVQNLKAYFCKSSPVIVTQQNQANNDNPTNQNMVLYTKRNWIIGDIQEAIQNVYI